MNWYHVKVGVVSCDCFLDKRLKKRGGFRWLGKGVRCVLVLTQGRVWFGCFYLKRIWGWRWAVG